MNEIDPLSLADVQPVAKVAFGVGGGAVGLLVVMVKGARDLFNGQRQRARAEARKLDIDGSVALGRGWQEMVAELRLEMTRRDRACEERMDALEQEVAKLLAGLHARDRIIVALAHGRRLTDDLRAILLDIAPAASPEAKDHHQ